MAKLKFHCLVLEITDRCNARCGMCYQAAGPKGSDLRGDFHLPLEAILRVIDEAAELENLGRRVHVSGGEAFIRYRELICIFRRAKARGFQRIGSTTNAFWAVNDKVAETKCMELADAGVNYLEVSMDYWHLPYVSLQRVRNLLSAARRVGITIILRTLSSRNHHIDELFASFTEADLLDVLIANGRVYPVGRGAEELSMAEVYPGTGVQGCCEDLLNLTVAPNGNVYPCCAGADMTESLACSNVSDRSLSQAVFNMETDRVIREVIHGGTGALVPLVAELGYGDRLKSEYSSICHLCWDIFRDNELADALRSHFQDVQLAELVDFLEQSPTSRAPDMVVDR